MIEVINNSSITYYDEPPLHIREYYNYCLHLLKNSLHQTQKQINVIFGDIPYNNVEGLTTLRIDIQCEHTIVKKEGRGVIEMIFGKTLDSDGNPVRSKLDNTVYAKAVRNKLPKAFKANTLDVEATQYSYYVKASPNRVLVNPIKTFAQPNKKAKTTQQEIIKCLIIW